MPTLAHTRVTAAGGQPTRWVVVLHGLLGRGSNWRSFARRLVTAAPAWGGVLVDLRLHGESQGFPGPHTVEAAAGDLDAVAEGLPGPVEAVVGHSLGGKVAMAWAARRQGLGPVAVLDASPSPRLQGRGSESTQEVLAVLRRLPPVVASREAFVERVVAAGQSPPIAQWLAMNLKTVEGGMSLAVDLEGMEALLRDVFRRDDWAVVESPPPGVRFDFVLGGRSMTVDAEARARLERLAAAGRIGLTVLPDAGHWVHVDDPEGTLQAVSRALS
jgi:pimeloyl-ACP methyl ester carboxylesterase